MKPVLVAFGATEEILPYAMSYMMYITVGFFFLSLTMSASGLLRAEGGAKYVMIGMIIGTVMNIILDPVFIFVFDMGIKGAAIATIISQFFSAVYFSGFYIRKNTILTLQAHHFKMKLNILTDAVCLGMPNFIQMAGMSLLILIINRTLGIYGGYLAISTYGMINRIFNLIILPIIGIVQGFQPIAGFNYGAGDFQRVKDVLKMAIIMVIIIGSSGFCLMMFGAELLMRMFTTDKELIVSSARALRIFVLCVPVLGVQIIGAAYFQSIGKKASSVFLSLLRQFILLIPLVLLLPCYFGVDGVWISFPIADFSATVITFIVLYCKLKHLKKATSNNLELAYN